MSTSHASSTWTGTLKAGTGTMRPANGPEVPFTLATRFEGKKGSNPEEMIGAALAGCFSMALSVALERAGMTPERIETSAVVHLEKQGGGFAIPRIELRTEVRASGGDEAKLRAIAEETKKQCPVGKALAAVEITTEATLVG
jgi:osmotically inducible protein OsmC